MAQKILALFIDEKVYFAGGAASSLHRSHNPRMCDMEHGSYISDRQSWAVHWCPAPLVKYSRGNTFE